MLQIRPYSLTDFEDVIQLIQANIPTAFAKEELEDFNHYLLTEREDYFVAEENGTITGCGGLNYFPEHALARLSWDMVHPDQQGKGIGKLLVQYRLNHLRQQNIPFVQVRTPQLAQSFYASFGFKTLEIIKDFWAEGLDLVDMRLDLLETVS